MTPKEMSKKIYAVGLKRCVMVAGQQLGERCSSNNSFKNQKHSIADSCMYIYDLMLELEAIEREIEHERMV